MRRLTAILFLSTLGIGACRQNPMPAERSGDSLFTRLAPRLPTGVTLDPVSRGSETGSFPLNMLLSPDGRRVILVLSGWAQQGLQVLDRASGRVTQTLVQPAGFIGAAFSPDGRTLFVSGGNRDVVYRYDWSSDAATLRDSVVLGELRRDGMGGRYPAGVGVSPDGKLLYVAENLGDALAIVDVNSGRVVKRVPTEPYPYDVAVAPDGSVYVSAWGGRTVTLVRTAADTVSLVRRIAVARHPSALRLNRDGTRLFVASGSTDQVAVMDTRTLRVIARLLDPPPAGPDEGTTPNAIALSDDGARLFVAEADANAIAVFDLTPATSNVPSARGDDRLAGRIPTGWYPSAVLATGDTLLLMSAKGAGTAPNPHGANPLPSPEHPPRGKDYTLGQLHGAFAAVPLARVSGGELAELTARVTRANHWTQPAADAPRYPPFEHVIYIIKENRTYDQVLGDVTQGDGDSSLMFFPRLVTPNEHALVARFGLYDRFFVNAEVSADGHNWSTAAYASDYVEKTVQSQYANWAYPTKGRWPYDYEGQNRNVTPEDDVNEPAHGYLWDLAQRKGITFRNYGEFVVPARNAADPLPPGYRGNKPFLYGHTNPRYPGFNLDISDQVRADAWLAEFQEYVAAGSMPALEIVRLPNDHTSAEAAGKPTPRAYVADNDHALGRIIEALSRSPFWKNTVVFVLEDDAQNGPDHVDSHRSPLFVISAYSRPGTNHRFANTTDVLRTIEEILGLESLAHFDYYGHPLRDIWTDTPDLRPYTALPLAVPFAELNPAAGQGARESRRLDLGIEDVADPELFNRILWRAIKPGVPYPGTRRMSALEARRGL